MSYKVTLIPGDGSGPEVIAALPCPMKPSNPSAETALR